MEAGPSASTEVFGLEKFMNLLLMDPLSYTIHIPFIPFMSMPFISFGSEGLLLVLPLTGRGAALWGASIS